MKGFGVLLLCTAGSLGQSCPTDQVSASDALSGSVKCVSVYRPGFVTIVSESNCGPCHQLLRTLKDLKSSTYAALKLQLLWTDRNRNDCTASAVKMAKVAESSCLTETDARKTLGVTGTPATFWLEDGKPRRSQGSESVETWRNRLRNIGVKP